MSDDYDPEEEAGFHFDPTDQELIKDYLFSKVHGKPCGDFIVMKDVKAKEPWLLDHTNDPFFKEDQWYYFVKRSQVSEKKIGCGKKTKRMITRGDDGIDRGSWKPTGKKYIIDEDTKTIIGVKQNLTFSKGKSNNKMQKIGDAASATAPAGSESSWNMTEFILWDKKDDTFQELVICKIKKKKKPKEKDDYHHHEASSSTYHHHHQPIYLEKQPIHEAHHHDPKIPRMIHQVDACSLRDKNEQVEAMEEEVTEKFRTKGLFNSLLINTNDQQPTVLVPVHMNAPPLCFGDKSLPIELDDASEEDELLKQELETALMGLKDDEDSPIDGSCMINLPRETEELKKRHEHY